MKMKKIVFFILLTLAAIGQETPLNNEAKIITEIDVFPAFLVVMKAIPKNLKRVFKKN
jgi:hypothetical protein